MSATFQQESAEPPDFEQREADCAQYQSDFEQHIQSTGVIFSELEQRKLHKTFIDAQKEMQELHQLAINQSNVGEGGVSTTTTSPFTLNPEKWHDLWRSSARGKAQEWQATGVQRTLYANTPTALLPVLPISSASTKRLALAQQEQCLRATTVLSLAQLVPVQGHTTRELVSLVVRRFYREHGWLPDVVVLSSLRFLSVPSRDYFPVGCESIGGYTMALRSDNSLDVDEVVCVAVAPKIYKKYSPYLYITAIL